MKTVLFCNEFFSRCVGWVRDEGKLLIGESREEKKMEEKAKIYYFFSLENRSLEWKQTRTRWSLKKSQFRTQVYVSIQTCFECKCIENNCSPEKIGPIPNEKEKNVGIFFKAIEEENLRINQYWNPNETQQTNFI